jgi:hypothetical protein
MNKLKEQRTNKIDNYNSKGKTFNNNNNNDLNNI